MGDHPLAQDLVATVQKQPLLTLLGDLRHGATVSSEAALLTLLIQKIRSGELDG